MAPRARLLCALALAFAAARAVASAELRSGCEGGALRGTGSAIVALNVSAATGAGRECEWTLTALNGGRVRLSIDEVDVGACASPVLVFEGDSTVQDRALCSGDSLQRTFSSSTVRIVFRTTGAPASFSGSFRTGERRAARVAARRV